MAAAAAPAGPAGASQMDSVHEAVRWSLAQLDEQRPSDPCTFLALKLLEFAGKQPTTPRAGQPDDAAASAGQSHWLGSRAGGLVVSQAPSGPQYYDFDLGISDPRHLAAMASLKTADDRGQMVSGFVESRRGSVLAGSRRASAAGAAAEAAQRADLARDGDDDDEDAQDAESGLWRGMQGATPLHLAAEGLVDDFELGMGVDVNATLPNSGITPLMLAASNGHVKLLDALLAEGDTEVGKRDTTYAWTALHHAAANAQDEALQHLLTRIRSASHVNARDFFGRTPLHLAVLTGNIAAVGALLNLDATDACAKDDAGNTVFHYMVDSSSSTRGLMAARLIRSAAKKVVDDVNDAGWRAVDAARLDDYGPIVKLLEGGEYDGDVGIDDSPIHHNQFLRQLNTGKLDAISSGPGRAILHAAAQHRLTANFAMMAEMVARTIVDELHLPAAQRSLKPLRAGPDEEPVFPYGSRYVVNHTLFTVLYPAPEAHSSDEHVSFGLAARELAARQHLVRLLSGQQALSVPLMAVVDYMGHRIVATFSLDSGSKRPKLVYGSTDGGASMAFDADADKALQACASELHLRQHAVGGHVVHTNYDAQVYETADGASRYLVNVARITPACPPPGEAVLVLVKQRATASKAAEANGEQRLSFALETKQVPAKSVEEAAVALLGPVEGDDTAMVRRAKLFDGSVVYFRDAPELAVNRAVSSYAGGVQARGDVVWIAPASAPTLTHRFRFEYLQTLSTAVNSDAFTPHATDADSRVATEAYNRLVDEIVPAFTNDLCAGRILVTHGKDVTQAMHKKGINLRFLGKVYTLADDMRVRAIVLTEMVCRVIKNAVRARLRTSTAPTDQRRREILCHFFNAALGLTWTQSEGAKKGFWEYLQRRVKKKALLSAEDEWSDDDVDEVEELARMNPSYFYSFHIKALLMLKYGPFGFDLTEAQLHVQYDLSRQVSRWYLLQALQEQLGCTISESGTRRLHIHHDSLPEMAGKAWTASAVEEYCRSRRLLPSDVEEIQARTRVSVGGAADQDRTMKAIDEFLPQCLRNHLERTGRASEVEPGTTLHEARQLRVRCLLIAHTLGLDSKQAALAACRCALQYAMQLRPDSTPKDRQQVLLQVWGALGVLRSQPRSVDLYAGCLMLLGDAIRCVDGRHNEETKNEALPSDSGVDPRELADESFAIYTEALHKLQVAYGIKYAYMLEWNLYEHAVERGARMLLRRYRKPGIPRQSSKVDDAIVAFDYDRWYATFKMHEYRATRENNIANGFSHPLVLLVLTRILQLYAQYPYLKRVPMRTGPVASIKMLKDGVEGICRALGYSVWKSFPLRGEPRVQETVFGELDRDGYNFVIKSLIEALPASRKRLSETNLLGLDLSEDDPAVKAWLKCVDFGASDSPFVVDPVRMRLSGVRSSPFAFSGDDDVELFFDFPWHTPLDMEGGQ